MTEQTNKWIQGRIVGKRQWTRSLFSLQCDAPGFQPFVAGQFARVGLPIADEIVGRPYSLVNAPDDPLLEIYAIEVAGGPLSPRLNALQVGDRLHVMPRANGFFSVRETPAADTLWCIATGTGLGPFLSILRTDEPWQQFKRVVLVHGTRHAEELTYRSEIDAIKEWRGDGLSVISLVSRDITWPALSGSVLRGRITTALKEGTLEIMAGAKLDTSAHVMLCGNPDMVRDMVTEMESRQMRKHRRREPGHYTTEAYW
jgi:ferredoxin/flavodoxin---NADP+ reductase